MSDIQKPVLIAGAGPTGMMAALELSRFGIPVRLVEQRLKPATTSRAVGIQARTLELFEQRGLATPLVQKGNQGVAVSTYGGGKRVFRLSFEHIDSNYKYILFVSQAETEKVLRDAIEKAGVSVEWGVTMVAFGEAEQSAGVVSTLKHQDDSFETLDCSYVISAEGAHSTARNTLGLTFEGKTITEDYALGDFYIDGELSDTDMHIFSSEDGFMGMFPMGEHRYRMIASNPISKASKDTEPSIQELQTMYDKRSHIPVRLRDLSWSSWFRINSRMVDKMRVHRIFVGGDSAHIHSPAGAQGMNTGMQDMVGLGWKLALVIKGQAKPEILDTYAAERISVIKGVLTKTEELTHAIGAESHIFRSVFNIVAPWVAGTEFVQNSSTEGMSQLALNYRGSPLSASQGHSGTLHAGDRMPDVPVALLNKKGTSDQDPILQSTFALMDPSRFTAFYCNGSNPADSHEEIVEEIGSWRYLIDGHRIEPYPGNVAAFNKSLGTEPSIVLVRPDGYIGFTGSGNSSSDLRAYLSKWLLPEVPLTNSQHA